MSESQSELPQVERFEPRTRNNSDTTIAVIAVIAFSVLVLACIASCTLIAYMFFSNPPW